MAMANPDFYQTLGVNRGATADEIRKAYRKLARENHPDVKKNDPQAAARFQQIQEAYAVLGDEQKRQQFDRFGTTFPNGGPGGRGGWPPGGGQAGPVDLESLFGGIDLGDLFGGTTGAGRAPKRPRPGREIQASTAVPFETAVQGGSVELQIDKGGTFERLTVKIPAGIAPGAVMRLAGQGAPSAFGGPPGDLLLTIQIQPHRFFRREGNDLFVDVPVTPSEAALGGKVEVPTLGHGIVMLTVPPGTSSGQKLRLRGQGVIDPSTKTPGDLFAVVKIVVPKELSEAARELYRQLQATDAAGTSPRTGLWG